WSADVCSSDLIEEERLQLRCGSKVIPARGVAARRVAREEVVSERQPARELDVVDPVLVVSQRSILDRCTGVAETSVRPDAAVDVQIIRRVDVGSAGPKERLLDIRALSAVRVVAVERETVAARVEDASAHGPEIGAAWR